MTAPLHDGRHSVRIVFTLIVAAIMIPTLLVGAWFAQHWASSERARIEQGLLQKSREIASDVDREISAATSMLTALATSRALRTRDFAAFHQQATEVAHKLSTQIVLLDPRLDRQLVNTSVPWGMPLPQGARPEVAETARRALSKGEPAVSNVFVGPVIKRPVVSVGVLAADDTGAAYYLAVGLPTDQFAAVLQRTAIGPEHVAAILDRNNAFISRSQGHDELTGTRIEGDAPPPGLREGVVKANGRERAPFYWFFHRTELTDWAVSVGIAAHLLDAPLYRATVYYGAASSVLFIVAVSLAYAFGARLSRSFGKQLSAAEMALRASEEQRRLAVEAAELGPWTWDFGNGEMWWSDRMRQILGVPDSMPANHSNWYDRVHPSDRHLVDENFRRRQAGERHHDYEYRIIRLDDRSARWVASKGQATFDATGKPVSVHGVIQDITARKDAEQARNDLRRRLMQAQEQERIRLSRELHDEAGQSLAAVLMQLKRIQSTAGEPEQANLRALHAELEQMGAALHRIAWELRPAAIDELGLTAVLTNYVSEWSLHFEIAADFHCRDRGVDKLADDIRATIYRVLQEALTNIAKHARGVTSVSIVIDRMQTELRLTVEDNGSGFEPASTDPQGTKRWGGLGLAGMSERLALVGGYLQIESSPNGSTIFARIPVELTDHDSNESAKKRRVA